MDIQEILIKVKRANRHTGNYDDEILTELIYQVMEDMKGMGVLPSVLEDRVSIGAIAQGVWEKDNLHQYTQDFKENVIRLREKRGV